MSSAADWAVRKLDYKFTDENLLQEALTHRSAGRRHNERLEFLGDAVLGLVIAEALYATRPEAREGLMSRYRALLVRRDSLAEVAGEIGLGDRLSLGSGESRTGGHQRKSILADALEAVIGAIYLDGGFDAAAAVIKALYRERLATLPPEHEVIDAKTALQELLQGRGEPPPEYRLIETSGPSHAQKFVAACRLPGLQIETSGQGRSRRKAEQAAAALAMAQLADAD